MKGKALEYIEYEPLYAVEREGAKFHYVVCDSYVTMSDGTGIVHIAPAFGEDDAAWVVSITCRSFSWWMRRAA